MTFKEVKQAVLKLLKENADYLGIPENRITIDKIDVSIAPAIGLHFRVIDGGDLSEQGINGWLSCLVAYIGEGRINLSDAQDDAMEIISKINILLGESSLSSIMKWANIVEPIAFETMQDGTPILNAEKPITGTQYIFQYNPFKV